MISLTDNDFLPVDECKLAWRWTDPKWALLPEDDLAKMRTVIGGKLTELWYELLGWHEKDGRLKSALFAETESILAEEPEQEQVKNWLRSRVSNQEQSIHIIWDKQTSIFTTWDIFLKWIDDFCYPGSDDITILPLSKEWILKYHHEEYFFFARRR